MSNESLTYEATDHATFDSKRKGNWATPTEIKSKLNKPVSENLVTVLTRLVKRKDIEKKKEMRLYRTRKGGAGGIGNLGNLDYESPRGDDLYNPPSGDRYTPPTGTGDRETPPSPKNTINAAIGAVLGGSVPGATGGTTGGSISVPR